MNNHLETLKNFQEWRRDEPAATFRQLGLTPKAIGEALDWAIQELTPTAQLNTDDGVAYGTVEYAVHNYNGIWPFTDCSGLAFEGLWIAKHEFEAEAERIGYTQQPPAPKPDHSDANKKAADGEQGQ